MIIINFLVSFGYRSAINPGVIDEILIKSEEQILEQNPNISDEQLEQALNWTEMFVSPMVMTIFSAIFSIIAGAILSLLIAIFVKRENDALV